MEADRIDTVPPPPGEDDAYSAPTKLHSMPPDDLLEAMKEATRKGVPLKPQSLPVRGNGPPSASGSDLPPKSGFRPSRANSTPPTEEWIGADELKPERGDARLAAARNQALAPNQARGRSRVVGLLVVLALVVAVAYLVMRTRT
jgi:hypothetical protein